MESSPVLFLALAAVIAQPQPGRLRTFGDWTVGCDNVRRCRAVALVPDAESRDDYLLLVVTRDAAPSARPVLQLSTADGLPGSVTLRVDGRPVLPIARAALLPLPPELAGGRRATLTDGAGRTLASASLAGLSAAFLYMDEQQRRLGTVGALIRRGPRPDSAVSAPPPLPRIVQPRPGLAPPRALAPAAVARLRGPGCDEAPVPAASHAVRLDARHSLVLVRRPCDDGAYNLMSDAHIVDEAGRTRPARFDVPTGMDGSFGNRLVNADWDPARRRLGDFVKARGLGDCGGRSSFAWDGARFRLVHHEAMGECRGSVDYITTWRAAVTTAR